VFRTAANLGCFSGTQAVSELESKRDDLKQVNQQLEAEMEELRAIWESHVSSCRIRDTDSPEDVKPFHLSAEAAAHQQHIHQQQQQQQQRQHQQQHQQHHHQLTAVSLHDEKPVPLSSVVVSNGELSSGHHQRIYTSMGGGGCNETLIIPDRIVLEAAASTSTTGAAGGGVSKLRPNSLQLPATSTATSVAASTFAVRNKSSIAEITGIPITTPSAEFIDSLIEAGSTGLTPVSTGLTPVSAIVSSCSTQLRSTSASIIVDLSSPDSIPSKLVSL